MPRKSEESASAPVSRAAANLGSVPSRKSARATGASKKRVRYTSTSDEEHCGDEVAIDEEDAAEAEETPGIEPKKRFLKSGRLEPYGGSRPLPRGRGA